MARVFDVKMKVAKKNRFDLFGFFSDDHVMTVDEMKTAAENFAAKFPQYKIDSYRNEGKHFILRVEERA